MGGSHIAMQSVKICFQNPNLRPQDQFGGTVAVLEKVLQEKRLLEMVHGVVSLSSNQPIFTNHRLCSVFRNRDLTSFPRPVKYMSLTEFQPHDWRGMV